MLDLIASPGSPPTGVMVCGHGSRDPEAVQEFALLVGRLAGRLEPVPVAYGYLEFARPIIRDGLERLRQQGVRRVLAIPGMLFAAGHVKNDVPSVLNEWSAATGIEVRMGRDLGIDARLLEVARDRIAAAEAVAPHRVPREETLLLVVGRGTSDADANGNVAKVTRMLWEGMGFGHAETGYSGVTEPRTDLALERAARLGFRRVIVFPWFLFTGVLVRRIHAAVDLAADRFPGIELLKAGYLAADQRVVETMVDRAAGTLTGDDAMNCSLCKYRVQIIGHESAVGAPQVGHHHHVEGIGTASDHAHEPHRQDDGRHGVGHRNGHAHGHDHDHPHGHDHDHAHDHPHGRGRP